VEEKKIYISLNDSFEKIEQARHAELPWDIFYGSIVQITLPLGFLKSTRAFKGNYMWSIWYNFIICSVFFERLWVAYNKIEMGFPLAQELIMQNLGVITRPRWNGIKGANWDFIADAGTWGRIFWRNPNTTFINPLMLEFFIIIIIMSGLRLPFFWNRNKMVHHKSL